MKKIAIVPAAAILLWVWGCSSKTVGACDDCNAKADTVVVKIKHSATVFNCCADAFTLSFNKVIQEARCPSGVECFWEGMAKIAISTSNSGDAIELQTVLQPNGVSIPNQRFSAKLIELSPWPIYQQPLDTNAYEAKIVVTRQ